MASHAIWTLQRTKHIHEIHDLDLPTFYWLLSCHLFSYNILIYSKTNEEHIFHLQQFMRVLCQETQCEHEEVHLYEVECPIFGLCCFF